MIEMQTTPARVSTAKANQPTEFLFAINIVGCVPAISIVHVTR